MTQLLAGWRIFTSHILPLLIVFIRHGHTETFDFTKCDIRDNFKSDLISASFRTLNAGLGCETRATSSNGHEVHIIFVETPMSRHDTWATVALSIHSRRHSNQNDKEGSNFLSELRPAIFVIHSPQPVTWIIDMIGFNTQHRHLFMVSKESFVRFQRKKARRLSKIRKRVLPFSANSTSLYDWATKRFGAVTSYSKISELNLKFYPGRDATANLTCDLNSLRQSRRMFSYYETLKPITGCVSHRRNNHVRTKPVYIIEIVEPPGPTPGLQGIDLKIVPYHNGASVRSQGQDEDVENDWHFYLVIKSPPSIQWTLHSKKTVGWIDIVADASTDVKVAGVKISTVALRADDIHVTGRELVEWSQVYIAPVHMYAGIHAANTIKLKVPPLEKDMPFSRDPTTGQNVHEPKMPREGGLGGGDNVYGETSHEVNGDWLMDGLIEVSCTDQIFEVAIAKQFFKMTGLDKSKVTLLDTVCGLTAETNDHVVICTGHSKCGTTSKLLQDGRVLFTNAVLVRATQSLSAAEEPGSGLFAGDPTSGSRDSNLAADDEDYRQNLISFSVNCSRPAMNLSSNGSQNKTSVSDQACRPMDYHSIAVCTLNLYSSDTFLQPAIKYPATVARNSTVYIETTVDKDLTILVDTCWFSTSSKSHDQNADVHTVISNGCNKGDSIIWLMDQTKTTNGDNQQKVHFKITVTDMFKDHTQVFLHCLFQTCHRYEDQFNDECPTDGRVWCQEIDSHNIDIDHHSSTSSSSRCGPLTVGPLHLVDPYVQVNSADDQTSTNSSNMSQEQRVIIEGLDSATVVGIAFAAFFIGILLIGTLWFIHSHTGPTKQTTTATTSSRQSVTASETNQGLSAPTAV